MRYGPCSNVFQDATREKERSKDSYSLKKKYDEYVKKGIVPLKVAHAARVPTVESRKKFFAARESVEEYRSIGLMEKEFSSEISALEQEIKERMNTEDLTGTVGTVRDAAEPIDPELAALKSRLVLSEERLKGATDAKSAITKRDPGVTRSTLVMSRLDSAFKPETYDSVVRQMQSINIDNYETYLISGARFMNGESDKNWDGNYGTGRFLSWRYDDEDLSKYRSKEEDHHTLVDTPDLEDKIHTHLVGPRFFQGHSTTPMKGRWSFVVDKDGFLRVGGGRHDEFGEALPALFAGEVFFDDGLVKTWGSQTGTYNSNNSYLDFREKPHDFDGEMSEKAEVSESLRSRTDREKFDMDDRVFRHMLKLVPFPKMLFGADPKKTADLIGSRDLKGSGSSLELGHYSDWSARALGGRKMQALRSSLQRPLQSTMASLPEGGGLIGTT